MAQACGWFGRTPSTHQTTVGSINVRLITRRFFGSYTYGTTFSLTTPVLFAPAVPHCSLSHSRDDAVHVGADAALEKALGAIAGDLQLLIAIKH